MSSIVYGMFPRKTVCDFCGEPFVQQASGWSDVIICNARIVDGMEVDPGQSYHSACLNRLERERRQPIPQEFEVKAAEPIAPFLSVLERDLSCGALPGLDYADVWATAEPAQTFTDCYWEMNERLTPAFYLDMAERHPELAAHYRKLASTSWVVYAEDPSGNAKSRRPS